VRKRTEDAGTVRVSCFSHDAPQILLLLMDGLIPPVAALQLKQLGANRLRPAPQRALLWQFLAQFRNPLVLYLGAVEGAKQWFYKRQTRA
jgi:hypothetical protein